MNLQEKRTALQQYLKRLASETDEALTERFELKRPPMPTGLYWRLRWLAGSTLRWMEARGLWRKDHWPVRLKQSHLNARATPLLIWALGIDKKVSRAACEGLSRMLDSLSGFAPVLITDVADFAYFSRLGWLVEFVPRLSGDGEAYDQRKLKYLANLYHGAPVLPVEIGLDSDEVERLRRQLSSSAEY